MWPGLLALVSIGAVAADQGGYFPTHGAGRRLPSSGSPD